MKLPTENPQEARKARRNTILPTTSRPPSYLSRQVEGRSARKGVQLRILKGLDHPGDGGIRAETGGDEGTEEVEHVEHVHVPGPGHEAADPSLHAVVVAGDAAGGGVEALVGAHRVLLDEVAEREDGRERVAELNDTEGRHDGDEPEEIGDGGRDDEGEGPVDRDDDGPEDLTLVGGQGREVGEIHQDVVVQDLDPDVAVETGGDNATDDGEHVTGGLPSVRADALVGDLVGVSEERRQLSQHDSGRCGHTYCPW